MSLSVQTNIEAFDAHRNLVNTSNQLSESMQKLSSGYRINKAADELGDFTINLRGPIVIHGESRLGRQVINEVGGYGVREPLFARVPLSEVRPATPAAPVAATGV